jgi:dihydroorotase
VLDTKGLIVCAGFVDLHCHLRQPGYEYKETIATGTEAAAIGGYTTVCCMPNTNPPIDNKAVVDFIKLTAITDGSARVLPIGCITTDRSGKELSNISELIEVGVVAFSDDGSPVSDGELMREALEVSLAHGKIIIEHCEDVAISGNGVMNEGDLANKLGLAGIPAEAEEMALERVIALAHLTGAKIHIAHVSTAGSVEIIRLAKEQGVKVSAEVTPHHLMITEDCIVSGGVLDTNAKVNPPLRTQADVDALVRALRNGTIDVIATDHAPHADVDKMCDFNHAAFGISGFETALGSCMSLVHSKQIDLPTLIAKLTVEPARVLDIPLLGTLKVGAPADVTIFNPDEEWEVDADLFASMGSNTPLNGCMLKGRVMATVFGGKVVYRDRDVQLEVM